MYKVKRDKVRKTIFTATTSGVCCTEEESSPSVSMPRRRRSFSSLNQNTYMCVYITFSPSLYTCC